MGKIFVLSSVVLWLLAPAILTDVTFVVDSVADSGDYYVYTYTLTNPSTSSGGLVAAEMDVGATAGTPALLTSSGDFVDYTGIGVDEPRAEVGIIVPPTWSGLISGRGALIWSFTYSTAVSEDSLAAGAQASGFGIRSSYLPGLRTMTYRPTPESCCGAPEDDGVDVTVRADPRYFESTGWSVGPRYRTSEVGLPLLLDQLAAICSEPMWISSPELCEQYRNLLVSAERLQDAGDIGATRRTLGALLRRLADDRSSSGFVSQNAYWLLKINLEHLTRSIGPTRRDAAAQQASS